MQTLPRPYYRFGIPVVLGLALLAALLVFLSPAGALAAQQPPDASSPELGRAHQLSGPFALAASPGDVVINEIMADPDQVADASGEWFELYNATLADIDLNGWTIEDAGSDSHTIANGGPLTITAGGYLVVGVNADSGTNGGLSVAYAYGSDMVLDDSADEIILRDAGLAEIDRVEYDGSAGFPTPTGAALALTHPDLDNNVGATWCAASTTYGDGDLGTPGAANDCGSPLVINEIHADPDAVFGDANGDLAVQSRWDEFVELVNVGGSDLDLSNWALHDFNNIRHVFPANTILPDQCAIVVFGGGPAYGYYGGSKVQIASRAIGLGLNENGDIVTVYDASATAVISYQYGTEGGQNVALTRDPDITGSDPLVRHDTATGSGGSLYSPGTKVDGSLFTGCPQGPELEVYKYGENTAVIGESTAYTLAVSSSGASSIMSVVLTDTLPVGVTYVEDDSGVTPSNPSPRVYVWNLGNYLSGEWLRFNLTVTINSGVAPGTNLTNKAEGSTTTAGDDPSNNMETWTLGAVPPPAPDLVVSKGGPDYGVIGEALVYTLTVVNAGNDLAASVTLTDTLPAGTTYDSDNSGLTPANPSPGVYVWSLGDMAASATNSFQLTVTTDAGIPGGDMLTNNLLASTTTPTDPPAGNSDSWTTTMYPLVTISDIQMVPDPGSDDASPLETEIVWVEGVVVAEPDEIDDVDLFVIADPAGGPWSGLPVIRSGGNSIPAPEGTSLRLLGQVDEFFGLTELDLFSGPEAMQVLATGQPLPSPEVLATAGLDDFDPSTSEQWEGVLLEFQGATVTNPSLGFGEWALDDGSGPTRADDLGGEDGDLTYVPALNDLYLYLRGIGWYSFSNYKVQPRYDADLELIEAEPRISKTAPGQVAPGDLFTYTITVENNLGYALTSVVVTDAVPAEATFAYALDGGSESGGVVTWNFGSLAYQDSLTARFAVTAPMTATVLFNNQYGVSAANFPTPTLGAPVATAVGSVRIHDIQGSAHLSPFNGQLVFNVPGVVTALESDGFYMQDPNPDANVATSEGIFVDTGASPGVSAGDSVTVTGDVVEVYPGGAGANGLATTQITNAAVGVVASGQPLPAPIVIGTGGRVPPNQVIDDDAMGNVETGGSFDPATDGIDFYESLEGMRVQVNNALVVGGNRFGEIVVVGNSGANAGLFSPRGGLVVQTTDFNPERILIDDTLFSAEPDYTVGDTFSGPVIGVLDYSFGNFKLLNPAALPALNPGGLVSETTVLTKTATDLLVASFNVLNLDPADPPAKFAQLGNQIVNHLNAPDIIALQEVQDNSGSTDDGVVAADQTYDLLIQAIQAAGGPVYEFREIAPLNNQDGGQPGANIRVGFLFRTDRGLTFVDRPGGDAVTPVTVTTIAGRPALSASPGRVAPTNSAFLDSRKSLAGEFTFNGRTLFVIANHFKSKSGDDPLFGRFQPPVQSTLAQRVAQAQAINSFVDDILAEDAHAAVIVLGDFNDFHFSTALDDLKGGVLTNLMDSLPASERYTFIFDGNAQTLDHILVSDGLVSAGSPAFDVVHTNAEFDPDFAASDHDPILARFTLPNHLYLPIVVKASGGGLVQVEAKGLPMAAATPARFEGPVAFLAGMPEGFR